MGGSPDAVIRDLKPFDVTSSFALRAPVVAIRNLRAVFVGALIAACVGLGGFMCFWVATGGSWFIVETPSMGTAAPVGTLLWVKPTAFDQLRTGDIISFRPPNTNTVYSHRIVAIYENGTLATKGELNGAVDPWRLRSRNIVGKVDLRWWGVGWLVEAAPIFLIGGSVLSLLVLRYTSPRGRVPAATVGIVVLLSIAIFVTRPLTRGDLLGFESAPGGARATYVSTGLLPVQVQAGNGGARIDLLDGQVGSVLVRQQNAHGAYIARLEPHLTWWMWSAVAGVCFTPALWFLVVGTRGERDEKEYPRGTGSSRRGEPLPPGRWHESRRGRARGEARQPGNRMHLRRGHAAHRRPAGRARQANC